MWSAIFFTGLTVHNVALFVTLFVLPSADLRLARLIPALIGGACLLYGVVWDAKERRIWPTVSPSFRRSGIGDKVPLERRGTEVPRGSLGLQGASGQSQAV